MALFLQNPDLNKIVNNEIISVNGNKYEILNVYGEGSFGKVLKCSNNDICEQYAIKEIKIKGPQDEALKRAIREFTHEYEMLDKLKSDCETNPIVCIIEHFENNGNYYIVMEDLFSKGYKEVLSSVTEDPKILLKIFNKLCESMLKLHSIKDNNNEILVHRDIKPDNIMYKVDDNNNVSIKFIDFGASCFECSTKPTGASVYSDPYLSSEILNRIKNKNTQKIKTDCVNENLCYKAGDYYSLGITLINILFGINWFSVIPKLSNVIDTINMQFQNDSYTKQQYLNKIKKYFFEQFYIIEQAINVLEKETNGDIYKKQLDDINKKNIINQIIFSINKLDNRYFENYRKNKIFLDYSNDATFNEIVKYLDYNILDLIPYVFRIKMFFYKLNYDLNLFSPNLQERYIRLKTKPITNINTDTNESITNNELLEPSNKRQRIGGKKRTIRKRRQHRRKTSKRKTKYNRL